ncbi:MAG: DUF1476 domain-containing protein [Pseudomonadota bacterium]|jgi:hypothetical protein
MTNFEDREKGFERKYINEQEVQFKINSKRNKLLANWASEILGFNEQQKKNYINEVIKADFEEAGDDDVFRKIKKDLGVKNIQDKEIRQKMSEFLDIARKEI